MNADKDCFANAAKLCPATTWRTSSKRRRRGIVVEPTAIKPPSSRGATYSVFQPAVMQYIARAIPYLSAIPPTGLAFSSDARPNLNFRKALTLAQLTPLENHPRSHPHPRNGKQEYLRMRMRTSRRKRKSLPKGRVPGRPFGIAQAPNTGPINLPGRQTGFVRVEAAGFFVG